MSRLVAVLLCPWFVMGALPQVITDREIPTFIQSLCSGDFPSSSAKPVKGVQRHRPRPKPIPPDWKVGSRAAQLQSADMGTQPKQFLDPIARYETGNYPNSVVVADFNGDGKATGMARSRRMWTMQ